MVGIVIGDQKIVGGHKTIRFNIRVGKSGSYVSIALFRYIGKKTGLPYRGNPAVSFARFLRSAAFRPHLTVGLAISIADNLCKNYATPLKPPE